MSATATKPVLATATPATILAMPWLPVLAAAIALLDWAAPRYEAAGVPVSPLVPALALAVGVAALVGWRALGAVAIGAAAGAIGWPPAIPEAQEILGAVVLFVQAAFGGVLMRRSSRPDDFALDQWAALRRLLAAAIACGVIGGLGRSLGDLAWSPDPSLRPFTLGLVHAVADAASIVIMVPIVFALAAPQRERWADRRRSVAAPLVVLAVLVALASHFVHERDRQQAIQRFERDAEVVFARTQVLLDAPLLALQALHGAAEASGAPPTASQFDSLARPWIKRSLGLVGMGWIEVEPAPLGSDAGSRSTPPTRQPAVEPSTAPNLRHLIGNLPTVAGSASAPTATVLVRPAVLQAARQATARATPVGSVPLALGGGADARPGVVLMQGLPGNPKSANAAVAFAVLSPETLVLPITASRGDAMRACLFDADARVEPRRLAGASGCESAAPGTQLLTREASFEYAGRQWTMRITQPVRTTGGVWLFALPALGSGALLALLLAAVTGRARRVGDEARSRTADLRLQLDQRAQTQHASERTVLAMLDAVQSGMALVDASGRIRHANAAFATLTGSTPAQLQHQFVDEVLVDDEHPAPGRFVRLIADADDQLASLPIRLRTAGGGTLPALVTLRVLRDEFGRPASAVCAVHDLSENLRRRQVEQALGQVLGTPAAEGGTPSRPVPLDDAADVRRLLCVCAQPGLVEELRTTLHDRPRVRIEAAASAEEALRSARTRRIALVMLDLDLPGADGLALMRELSAERLPVVALSRDLRPQRIDAAFAAGARAYLTLPPEPRELLAVIDDLV